MDGKARGKEDGGSTRTIRMRDPSKLCSGPICDRESTGSVSGTGHRERKRSGT